MGQCTVGKKELGEEIEKLLDSLEGVVFEQDFREMANEVADNYKHFTEEEKDKDWKLSDTFIAWEDTETMVTPMEAVKKFVELVKGDIQVLCKTNHFPEHYFDLVLDKRVGDL